jgi:hypothetical protein
MASRVETHDDIHNIPMVYLGPDDHTMPFEARYQTLGVWLVLIVAWWALDRYVLLGQLGWAVFVIGPISATLLMQIVDHERPLVAHAQSFAREVARVAQRRRQGPQAVDVLMRVELRPAVGPVKKSRVPRFIVRQLRAFQKKVLPDG